MQQAAKQGHVNLTVRRKTNYTGKKPGGINTREDILLNNCWRVNGQCSPIAGWDILWLRLCYLRQIYSTHRRISTPVIPVQVDMVTPIVTLVTVSVIQCSLLNYAACLQCSQAASHCSDKEVSLFLSHPDPRPSAAHSQVVFHMAAELSTVNSLRSWKCAAWNFNLTPHLTAHTEWAAVRQYYTGSQASLVFIKSLVLVESNMGMVDPAMYNI